MKKLLPLILTLALMVMLADSSGLSFAIEMEEGGAYAFSAESVESSAGSFAIENQPGGAGSFSVESPDTAASGCAIENESGGAGSFVIELLDGGSGLGLFYAQYPDLFH